MVSGWTIVWLALGAAVGYTAKLLERRTTGFSFSLPSEVAADVRQVRVLFSGSVQSVQVQAIDCYGNPIGADLLHLDNEEVEHAR